jgi:hypothetical protein
LMTTPIIIRIDLQDTYTAQTEDEVTYRRCWGR